MITTTLNVPESVRNNVKKYFDDELKYYEVVAVGQTLGKAYTYIVLAKKSNSDYFTVWTCWNESTQSLNHGHYDLTEVQAMKLFMNPNNWNSQRPSEYRLSEIATKCIDGLREDDEESALVYLRDEVELTEEECEYFGVDYEEMQEV